MTGPRVSFSFVLIFVELTLWFVLVPMQTGLVYLRMLRRAGKAESLSIRAEGLEMRIPRDRFLYYAFQSVTLRESHAVTAINLPGVFVEVSISLPTTWPAMWHPKALLSDSWRAAILPFFCLPAWWFVGRGLDGVVRKRRLPWIMLVGGTVLFLACIAFWGGFLTSSVSERRDLAWLMPGVAIWTLGFGTFLVVWIRRRAESARA